MISPITRHAISSLRIPADSVPMRINRRRDSVIAECAPGVEKRHNRQMEEIPGFGFASSPWMPRPKPGSASRRPAKSWATAIAWAVGRRGGKTIKRRPAGTAERMRSYGQLDSIGDDINLADAGLIYVFVCLIDIEARAHCNPVKFHAGLSGGDCVAYPCWSS
jgi:hypothetical protein